MAKFDSYSDNSAPADADLLISTDVSDTSADASGTTKKLTVSTLLNSGLNATVGNLTVGDDLLIEGSTPTAEWSDTNGTVDQRKYRVQVKSGNNMLFQSLSDADTSTFDFLRFTPATGVLDTTGATAVTVPVPTTTGHALRWGSDATVGALDATTGDFTGDVTIAKSQPVLHLDGSTSSYLLLDGTSANIYWRDSTGVRTAVMNRTATDFDWWAGDFSKKVFSFNLSSGAVTMAGAASVTVPDSTVATEALNVQTADARYGDRIWLSAADMNVTNGLPVLELIMASRNIGWEFLYTGGEQLVAGSVVIPAGWSTFDMNVWWFASETVGDVVFRRRMIPKGPGDTGGSGGGSADTTATVDAVTNTITSTTLASGSSVGTGGSNIFFPQVGRDAGDAADTCVGSIYILGLELVRVS